jgi:hypothetical protein
LIKSTNSNDLVKTPIRVTAQWLIEIIAVEKNTIDTRPCTDHICETKTKTGDLYIVSGQIFLTCLFYLNYDLREPDGSMVK